MNFVNRRIIALNGIEEVYYYTYDSDAFHQAIFDSHMNYIDTLRDVEERSKQYRDLDEENRVKKLAYLRQMLTKVTEEDYNQVCECIDEWQINDSISNECNFNYIKRPSKEESIYQNADYELYYQAIDDYEKVFKDTLLNLEYTWLEEKPELDIDYMSDYILMMFFNDMEHYVVNARLEFYEEGIIRLCVQGNFYLYYQYDADAFMKTISDAKAEMNKIHDDISRKYN